MNKLAAAGSVVFIALVGCAGEDTQFKVEDAARQAVPDMSWQASVVSGDFTCRARPEYAILGTGRSEIVVVVLASGEPQPIGVLRFAASVADPKSLALSREDLDAAVEEFERDAQPLPEGLYPSKTCGGLRISDGRTVPTHIYWNRKAKRFGSWTR